eukprot:scaffold1491_cov92-Phaeocystis_antarctica.AAC.2
MDYANGSRRCIRLGRWIRQWITPMDLANGFANGFRQWISPMDSPMDYANGLRQWIGRCIRQWIG